MRTWAASIVLALAGVLCGGCGEDATTTADLGVGGSDQLILTAGGQSRAMSAYYGFYVQPITTDENEPPGVYLLVTAIDPSFRCDGSAPGAVDALTLLFQDRSVGATSTTVLSRRGPDLGATTGGDVSATIDGESDGLSGYDLDAGTVQAVPGQVSGRVHFQVGGVTLDGSFAAPRCAALDFIVPG